MRDVFINFLLLMDSWFVDAAEILATSWHGQNLPLFASWFHYLNWHNCRIFEPSTRYDRCIKRKIISDRLSVLYIQVFSTRILHSSTYGYISYGSSNITKPEYTFLGYFPFFYLKPCLKQALIMLLGAFEATSGIWMMIRCFRHLGRFCSFAHPNFLVIDIAVLSSSPQKNIGGLSDFKPFKLKNHYRYNWVGFHPSI